METETARYAAAIEGEWRAMPLGLDFPIDGQFDIVLCLVAAEKGLQYTIGQRSTCGPPIRSTAL